MPLRLKIRDTTTPTQRTGLDRLIRDDESQDFVPNVRRHSSIVKLLRLALPLIAVGLVVIMMVWSDQSSVSAPVPRNDIDPKIQGRNELVNPKFESKDTDLQPYTITADKAFQKEDDLNVVILNKPTADISLKDGAWLAVTADHGEFDQVKQILKLYGHVRLFHDDGYELLMDSIAINIIAQKAVSVVPVNGHGPIGTISAQGLVADGSKGTLLFTGPSHMSLNQ